MAGTRTSWDHARTALILAHVLAITLMALPVPGAHLTDKNKNSPAIRQTLTPWADLVQRVGLADSPDAAVDWLWDTGGQYNRAHAAVAVAFRPYIKHTGQWQMWGMFGYSPNTGGALQIHGRTASGDYEPLYLVDGPQWQGRVLNHHRIRKLRYHWSQKRKRSELRMFARWLATQDHGYPAIRVRMQGVRIPGPQKLRNNGLIDTNVYWEMEVEAEP